jgi:predicted  nucleic acid-binding Zn-ribbon protein
MEEVLQNLANLQYIDSRIDEITRLRGDLPEEILDIETDISRLEAKINKINEDQINLKKEEDELKLEIEEANGLVDKYEKQQMAVRNNREYDALTKEIESQKQKVENAKSRLEEIVILNQENEKTLEDSIKEKEEIEKTLVDKKADLKEVIKRTEEEENALRKKRNKAAEELSERYLKSYQRLRDGLTNGMAVVPMERGSCLGMMLPPQTQMEVRRKNKIIIDENSGRIVVDKSFFDEAKKAMMK